MEQGPGNVFGKRTVYHVWIFKINTLKLTVKGKSLESEGKTGKPRQVGKYGDVTTSKSSDEHRVTWSSDTVWELSLYGKDLLENKSSFLKSSQRKCSHTQEHTLTHLSLCH